MSYYYTKYTYKILDFYRVHLPWDDPIQIGFTGVASEKPVACQTSLTSDDVLLFCATVDFNATGVKVRMKTTNPQYEWNANSFDTPDTPISAIAGLSNSAFPNLALVAPVFLKTQGRVQMQFTNAPAGAVTGGQIVWRGLRLRDPINGVGWDYSMGVL